MAKGRKAIPNELKKHRGTNQPVRMKKELPTDKLTRVSAPRVLKTSRARKIFRDKSKQLIRHQILTELDLELLAVYANSLDMVFACIEKINDDDFVKEVFKERDGEMYLTSVIVNPHIKIYKDMLDAINRIGGEFGFSPVSRLKFAGVGKNENNDEDKDFD